ADETEVALELVFFDLTRGRRVLRGTGPAPLEEGRFEAAVGQLVGGALESVLRPRAARDEETPVRRRIETTPASPPPEPVEDEPPLYGRWWFWAGVAGVLVAGAATTLVLTSRDDRRIGADPGGQIVLSF
ncbi:MAG: hypothetical protein RMK74_11165, partial [Myxococcales bacterium]|nr:hypothetical protein [Myxococcales bacterium]